MTDTGQVPPNAILRPRRWFSWVWIVPAVAAAIVIGLVHDLITPITQLTNYHDMTPFVLAAIALLVMSRGQVMSRSREEG